MKKTLRINTSLFILLLAAGCFWLLSVVPVGRGMSNPYEEWLRTGYYQTATPSISKNLCTMIFASPSTGRGDIVILSLETGERVTLQTDDSTEYSPVYSSAGIRFAYGRIKGNLYEIVVYDTVGKKESVILTSPDYLTPVRFCEAGDKLEISKVHFQRFGLSRSLSTVIADVSGGKSKEFDGTAVLGADCNAIYFMDQRNSSSAICKADFTDVAMSGRQIGSGTVIACWLADSWIAVLNAPHYSASVINSQTGETRTWGSDWLQYPASDGTMFSYVCSDNRIIELWDWHANKSEKRIAMDEQVTGIRGDSAGFVVSCIAVGDKTQKVYWISNPDYNVQFVAEIK